MTGAGPPLAREGVLLRPGSAEDLPALSAVRADVMRRAWMEAGAAEAQILRWLDGAGLACEQAAASGLLLVAEGPGAIAGCSFAWIEGSSAHMGGAMLCESVRGMGLGARMLELRLQWSRRRGARIAQATACASFQASRRTLEAAGFRAYQARPDAVFPSLTMIDFRLQL